MPRPFRHVPNMMSAGLFGYVCSKYEVTVAAGASCFLRPAGAGMVCLVARSIGFVMSL